MNNPVEKYVARRNREQRYKYVCFPDWRWPADCQIIGGLMRERDIEQKLVKAVEHAGGKAWKFTSPGTDGVPDRILLFPSGRIAFAELKAPGRKLRPLQERRKVQLAALGFTVFVIDSTDQIPAVIAAMESEDH